MKSEKTENFQTEMQSSWQPGPSIQPTLLGLAWPPTPEVSCNSQKGHPDTGAQWIIGTKLHVQPPSPLPLKKANTMQEGPQTQ